MPDTRILYIEDSQTVFLDLASKLTRLGYRVDQLPLLVTLPQLLADSPPDLILLDINMPGLDGAKVAQLIKDYQRSPIPIVIYSACSEQRRKHVQQQIGAAAQLPKPSSTAELHLTIQSTLQSASSADTP